MYNQIRQEVHYEKAIAPGLPLKRFIRWRSLSLVLACSRKRGKL